MWLNWQSVALAIANIMGLIPRKMYMLKLSLWIKACAKCKQQQQRKAEMEENI